MITVKLSELNKIRMSTNPPECVVKADCKVILNGMVKQYIGIGWIDIAPATPKDYETIPQVID
jgi:hypothetical protein